MRGLAERLHLRRSLTYSPCIEFLYCHPQKYYIALPRVDQVIVPPENNQQEEESCTGNNSPCRGGLRGNLGGTSHDGVDVTDQHHE